MIMDRASSKISIQSFANNGNNERETADIRRLKKSGEEMQIAQMGKSISKLHNFSNCNDNSLNLRKS